MLGFFGLLLTLLVAVIPISSIVIALRASGRADRIAARLKFAEDRLRDLEGAAGAGDLPGAGPGAPPSPEEDAAPIEPAGDQGKQPPRAVPEVPPLSEAPETADAEMADQMPPADAPSFEERLGTKWAVYVGGIALAIGGILLVRYSIEAGLIGPGTRVTLGALFSAALLSAGEWFRRRDIDLGIEDRFAAHIPSVLTAAGTIAAFATVYAAYALYQFISGPVAFVLLGIIGLATMIGSALHGPALAALGLAGSHVTPLLVSSQSPSPWPLIVFLAFVSGAALMLARLRHWPWLVWANVAGVVLWGFALNTQNTVGFSALWATAAFMHIGVQTVLLAVLLVFVPYFGEPEEESDTDWIALGALAALAGLFVFTQSAVSFHYVHWVLAAGAMVVLLALTGLANAPVAASVLFAGIVINTTLFIWANARGGIEPPVRELIYGRLPDGLAAFLAFGIMTSLGVLAGSAYRLYRGSVLPFIPALSYALAMTVPVLAALTLSYLRITDFGYSLSFAAAGAVLAAGYATLADMFDRGGVGHDNRVGDMVAGIAALAAVAALSFALVTCLGRGYLTVAFALTALGAAAIAIRRDMPILRYVLIPIGLVVLARLIWDPRIAGDDIGSWPLLNWLLIGYGVPAASFAAAAWLLRQRGVSDVTVQFSEALALVFTALLVFFEIRHFIHDGDILARTTGHVELGLFAITSLGFSYAISRFFTDPDNAVFQAARIGFAGFAGLIVVLGLAITQNPYFNGDPVAGIKILSSLLPGYLLPGLFALYVARVMRGEPHNQTYALAAACLGLGLVFAYVTLEVRHVFHGENIRMSLGTSDVEMWAYNISWLALAILSLGYGLVRQSLPARIASALLLTATVLKIGLFDLAGLTGFWRAFSFICLGAVLIGIGLVYQRLIFARPVAGEVGESEAQ